MRIDVQGTIAGFSNEARQIAREVLSSDRATRVERMLADLVVRLAAIVDSMNREAGVRFTVAYTPESTEDE